MSNLKALRNRVKSIKSTQKITKAMKMVSAAKLYRAKESSAYTKAFRQKVEEILIAAKAGVSEADCNDYTRSMLFGYNEMEEYDIAIVISSDRGLCGNYVSSVLKLVRRTLPSDFSTKLIVIGNKILDFLRKDYSKNILFQTENKEDASIISDQIIEILNEQYQKNKNLKVGIFYTEFKNILNKTPRYRRIWPIDQKALSVSNNTNDKLNNMVEFEGDNLLQSILDLYLRTWIISAILDSKASEEASRTTAMDNATKNAGEMIDSLTLIVNRTRQANITRELIEVISGVEAS